MYKEKLRERDRRKTVVKELGLIEAFFKVVFVVEENASLSNQPLVLTFALIRRIL